MFAIYEGIGLTPGKNPFEEISVMLPDDVLIKTKVAKSGMTVRALFEECLESGVQSLPYLDQSDMIVGRVTLKHVINRSVVPAHVAELAHVIGPRLSSFDEFEERMARIFEELVDSYVQEPHTTIYPDTHLMKALAVMEHNDTSYLFVVDGGHYRGTLTIQGIARWMMRMVAEP